MGWRLVGSVLLVAVMACGEPAPSDPVIPAIPTTVPGATSAPASTSTPTTTTTQAPPPTVAPIFPNILRPDGIGPVDFGDPASEAMTTLTEILGPPDAIEELGASDFYMSVTQARLVTWDSHHLRLAFTDWNGDWSDPASVPLHLSDWEVFGPGLATAEGIGPGSAAGEILSTWPGVQFGINEFAPTVYVQTPWGAIRGSLAWPSYEAFDAALQAALAEQGFPTDGRPGSGTGQALIDFMEARGLDAATGVLSALGLPPPEIPIGWMHAGTGPLCC